jgi:hypothetical protein
MPIETVWAKNDSLFESRKFLFYFAGDLALTASEADKLPGVNLTQNMRTPLVAVAGVGGNVFKSLWLGMRYEYWFSGREWTTLGTTYKERLNLQMVGPEISYVRGNPRINYHFSIGGMYPWVQKVTSSSAGIYARGSQFWSYHARAAMELKFNSRLGLHLESGYRWLNLRDLQSNGTSFIPGGADLNLSGPFVGMGFSLFF